MNLCFRLVFLYRICELNDVYGEGSISPNVAFPYIMFINNLSQFVAMYCLVLFYRANKVCVQSKIQCTRNENFSYDNLGMPDLIFSSAYIEFVFSLTECIKLNFRY